MTLQSYMLRLHHNYKTHDNVKIICFFQKNLELFYKHKLCLNFILKVCSFKPTLGIFFTRDFSLADLIKSLQRIYRVVLKGTNEEKFIY